jgi:protein-S-isoprenylcysteine O-methyltransferase Ste14
MAPLIFHPSAYLAVFVVVIVIWIGSEVVGGMIIPNRRRRGGPVQQPQKRLNVLGLLGYDAVILSSVLFAAFGVTVLPNWAYFIGIALILTGVSVRQWAIAVLGRYFSHVIGIQQDQKIVQSGPYRVVRHPSYTGILLILLGIAFSFQTWGGVFVAVTAFGLAWGYRMLAEERFLERELGDNYAEYAQRTKRVLPYLI